MAKTLLHGMLHVTIYGCRGIAAPQKSGGASGFFQNILSSAQDAMRGDNEYYATVDLDATRVGRTRVLKDHTREPVWNESFRIYCCHNVSELMISIKDGAIIGTEVIGRAKVQVDTLLSGELVEDWYQLFKGEDQIDESQVQFRLQFFEASHDPHWGLGISDPVTRASPTATSHSARDAR